MAATSTLFPLLEPAAVREQQKSKSIPNNDGQDDIGIHRHHNQHYPHMKDAIDEGVEKGNDSLLDYILS